MKYPGFRILFAVAALFSLAACQPETTTVGGVTAPAAGTLTDDQLLVVAEASINVAANVAQKAGRNPLMSAKVKLFTADQLEAAWGHLQTARCLHKIANGGLALAGCAVTGTSSNWQAELAAAFAAASAVQLAVVQFKGN